MRTGREFLSALDGNRSVYLDGARLQTLTTHPGFEGIARTVAALYDFAADPENGMLVQAGETNSRVNRALVIPRTTSGLRERRTAIGRWAEMSNGFLTCGPDHGACFVAGFAGAAAVFEAALPGAGRNLERFYARMLDEDLFVACAFIPPQVGRIGPPESTNEFSQVGVKKETGSGIVVRGAQMLATGAALSDYLLVGSLKPLRPGEQKYALTFVVPVGAAGLKLSLRRSYAAGVPSEFDYPLSSRFDESDALVVFDDVHVPWEDVFVYRNVGLADRQWQHTAADALATHQTQTRIVTKMTFLVGLGSLVVSGKGLTRNPAVHAVMGEIVSIASAAEAMLIASEFDATLDENGVCRPATRFLDAAMALQAQLYPRLLHLLRDILGTTVIQTPSSYHDLVSEETRDMVRGLVGSSDDPRAERVKLFKLAWDAVGSEFAGRNLQYEMSHIGSSFVGKARAHERFHYDGAEAVVERFLASYQLPS